eukprot:snap_masked-scaffold83_size396513-processed-gene-0.1 protein:Tk00955 transcript:snap_masked-scaffold83_size396513-processed-gene-0.1-mRNA-1 annotation:"cyclic nucleotide-gated cation channel beta-1"
MRNSYELQTYSPLMSHNRDEITAFSEGEGNVNFTGSERTSGSRSDVTIPIQDDEEMFVEETWMQGQDYADDSLRSVSIDIDERVYEQTHPPDDVVYVKAEVEVHEVPKELRGRGRPVWARAPSNTPIPPMMQPLGSSSQGSGAPVMMHSSVIGDLDRISTLHSLDESQDLVLPTPPFMFYVQDESLDCDILGGERQLSSDFSGHLSSPFSLYPSPSVIAHLPSCQNQAGPGLRRKRFSVSSGPSVASNHSWRSDVSSMLAPDREQALGEKIRGIVFKFRHRATLVKRRLEFPPTPDHSSEDEDDPETPHNHPGLTSQPLPPGSDPPTEDPRRTKRDLAQSALRAENNDLNHLRNIALRRMVYEDFNASLYASKSTIDLSWGHDWTWSRLRKKLEYIDPRGYINIFWLSLQALVFLYNAWVIPLRFFFPFTQNADNLFIWLLCDYCGDLIYLLDLLVYKHRLLYMENGFWVKDRRRLTIHYVTKGTFGYDLMALMPTDILYIWLGMRFTIVRFPRLIKVIAFWEFIYRLDAVMAKPYILRIVKTVNYMLYLIHLNACAYYAMSDWEGIGSNTFVYNGQGSAYIRCFYFATKTATSIGKNKKPTNIPEILFMTASWLMGVFVFAILIGDIRDIVSNARKSASSFQKQMDAVADYMNRNRVNKEVQGRVKMWMHYTWELQKSFDEAKVLEFLPLKTRTDIAMRVHYPTLVKVKLFRNCEPGLLKDLVIKLRPVIYLPGDHICRKDDIGTEMFIIQSGQVHVLGGLKGHILCTLGEGSVFGEIALLGVGGMNKRTADVVSVGFSNLFVLQKADLEEVLQDYPDAKQILNARARKLMKENEQRIRREEASLRRKNAVADDDDVIFPLQRGKREPALIDTVLKALPASSLASAYLRRGSKASLGSRRRRARTVSVDFGRLGSEELADGPGPRSWSLDQQGEQMTAHNFSSLLSDCGPLNGEDPSRELTLNHVSVRRRHFGQSASTTKTFIPSGGSFPAQDDKISIQSFQTIHSEEESAVGNLDLEATSLAVLSGAVERDAKC